MDNSIEKNVDNSALNAPAEFEDTKKQLPRGSKAFLILSMVVVVILLTVFFLNRILDRKDDKTEEATQTSSAIFNSLKLPQLRYPDLPKTPSVEDSPSTPANQSEPTEKPVMPKIIGNVLDGSSKRRLASSLRGDDYDKSEEQNNNQEQATYQMQGDSGPIADQLRPLELQPSVASQLGDRNFLMTQGTMIDCVMQSKLITTQSGLLTCIATDNVMSANGKVVLIDAGTKFTGYQTNGIIQGQARAFVTWNRLETPNGVILNLNSPGVGSLGEAGLDGAVDYHFWDRFQGAILLSLIGDLGAWASNQGNSGNNNIRFDNTRDGAESAISTILEHSLAIPPTLYKNQGERIGIMVARDLDFSKVYSLKAK